MSTGKDYRTYRMQPADVLAAGMGALGISVGVAWLFYSNAYGLLVILAVWPLLYWQRKRGRCRKQQRNLGIQFKECIRIVTASMYSGYSVENAFLEAEKELVQLLGKETDICRELYSMNQQLRLNVPVEVLLQELADRSGVEEIFGFGQVFGYAKRNGSNFTRILKDTSERIAEKLELEREIQTMIAAKKLEQRIMNVIPFGILAFVNITSPGFLQVMYSGAFGRILMSICLAVYAGAYLLSEKLVDIQI